MTDPVPILQVDAFSDAPFGGNPAAVCLLPAPLEAAWMQAVAAEMNLAETAFSWPEGAGYRLRWFTPTVEVPLCGHATLATAHVLRESRRVRYSDIIEFYTHSGTLGARVRGDAIELDFPQIEPRPSPLPDEVAAAIGAGPGRAFRIEWSDDDFGYLVELADERAVRAFAPDLSGLRRPGAPHVLVTARADVDGADFVSRFFAPGAGIDEDPVTGSAHCALAPYWAAILGRDELVGFQASRRGGRVGVRLVGDRVELSGRAVTVLRGELLA